jgi:hypothetical protein
MEKKENILQELREISLVVATISNRNVYSVPAGYFEALADTVLADVQTLSQPAVPAPYNVPEGYFDTLASSILKKIKQEEDYNVLQVHEELEELAPLLNSISKTGPFNVPAGYFDGIVASTLNKLNNDATGSRQPEILEELEQTAPLLNKISTTLPYSVPSTYFQQLAANVLNSVKAAEENMGAQQNEVFEELEQLAPVLNTIKKTGPYTVPGGYFEQFKVPVHSLENVPEAKIVQIHHRKTRWVTWLAAASIISILATGGFLFWKNGAVQNKPSVESNLANVSDDDISNYLNTLPVPGIEAVSTSVMDQEIPDVKPVIKNMSTEDIKEYLNKNSDPGEKGIKDI